MRCEARRKALPSIHDPLRCGRQNNDRPLTEHKIPTSALASFVCSSSELNSQRWHSRPEAFSCPEYFQLHVSFYLCFKHPMRSKPNQLPTKAQRALKTLTAHFPMSHNTRPSIKSVLLKRMTSNKTPKHCPKPNSDQAPCLHPTDPRESFNLLALRDKEKKTM